MSTIENGVSKEVVPNPHAEAAQQRVDELRKTREVIPHFVIPASTRRGCAVPRPCRPSSSS
ncbi:MAG TPA: hypothetical protein VFP80_02660 [Thermoanaerobaculia bacterium]|nr:hypothetical protein [Thermoanaerobaculia bacterium]